MLLRFFSFLIALALLGLVVAETDLAQVDRQLNAVGPEQHLVTRSQGYFAGRERFTFEQPEQST